jgi:hypothetical protein
MSRLKGVFMEKQAKVYGIICSVLYLALFFPAFYIGMLIPHLLENANVTTRSGIAIVFLSILAPIMIIIGIGMIWYKYFSGNYRGAYLACLFPLLSCLAILFLMFLIKIIFL